MPEMDLLLVEERLTLIYGTIHPGKATRRFSKLDEGSLWRAYITPSHLMFLRPKALVLLYLFCSPLGVDL